MKQMTKEQMEAGADALRDGNKRWRHFEISQGEFIVVRVPEPKPGPALSTPADGEKMVFWRFGNVAAANRFRNHKIVNEIMEAIEIEGIAF